jgi:predicted transcriptional regulator
MTLKAGGCYDENDIMEIHLTEREQEQIRDVAQRTGRNNEDVLREAINSFLRHESEFVEAVAKGLASLDRGEYISHEEVTARIDQLFRS